MEKKLFILLFSVFILAIGCTNKNKHISDTNKSATEISIVSPKSDSIESYKRKKMWEEANQYRNSITDTTFLKTKGEMSDAAIDAFNPNYAFNQVVYLKALERAKKHLSFQNNQLVFPIKKGSEIYISEDLYKFISETFDLWNEQLKSGNFELKKDEKELYVLYPKTK